MISWSVVEYKKAYECTENFDYVLDQIKWPLDYLIKCHTADHEFQAGVGDGTMNHDTWNTAEYIWTEELETIPRISWKVTEE